MNQQAVLLSMHYLPCIEWFKHYLSAQSVLIEQNENYLKQTYRNRTVILGANGPLSLTIPVKKIAPKTTMADMLIDNSMKWQHQHWGSIVSSYQSSPYFMYYEHYFASYYTQPFDSLFAFNKGLLDTVLKIMKVEKTYELTTSYRQEYTDRIDLRQSISPKTTSALTFQSYLQVFTEKFPFEPNLSILDLLFNKGPESVQYLAS